MRTAAPRAGVGLTTAVNGSILIVGLLTGVITARGFDPSDRGQFLAVVLWSGTIAAFALTGLDQALIYGARGDHEQVRRLAHAIRRRIMVRTSIGFLLAVSVNALLLETVQGQARLWISLLGALPVMFNGVTQMRLAPLLVASRFGIWNLCRLASPAGYVLALVVLLVVDELSIGSALAAVALGSFASMAVVSMTFRAHSKQQPSEQQIRDVVRFGWRTLLISVPAFVAARVDQLLLGLLVEPSALGIYAVSVSVASVVEVLKQTVDQLAFPHFARAGWRRRTVRMQAVAVTGLALMSCGVLYLAAQPLIPLVYGDSYSSALVALPWLLLAAALRVGASILEAAAKARGQLQMMGGSQAVGLAITIAALMALLPTRGPQGAAEAVLLGQSCHWMIMFFRLSASGLDVVVAEEV